MYTRTHLRRIGNSLGSTIPADVVRQLNLAEGSQLDISSDGEMIFIRPVREKTVLPKYSEAELLQNMIVANIHADELADLTDEDFLGVKW